MLPIASYLKKGLINTVSCLSLISMVLGATVAPVQVSANPSEIPQANLVRTEQSGLQLSTSVSKNLYRQEAYDTNYTVQVPYQETEAYTDYETDYRNETQCRTEYENSCRYEQECRQVPGPQQCRQEYVCGRGLFSMDNNDVSGQLRGGVSIQGCRQAEECGTNARGERICKTRQVCDNNGGGGNGGGVRPGPGHGGGGNGGGVRPGPGHGGGGNGGGVRPGPGHGGGGNGGGVRPGPGHGGGGNGGGQNCRYETRCDNGGYRNDCRQVQRCHQIPRERCSNVSVPYTRPVTKYRTVTKYRNETKCCKTAYRQVFDRQEALDVVINFPAGSELFPGERENFRVTLIAGVNQQPDVQFEVLSQLSNYRIIDKTIQGRLATLTLEAIPVVISVDQVGINSVSGVKLKIMENLDGVVVFSDVGQKGRLVTVYDIIVKDGSGTVVAAQQAGYNGVADQRIVLSQKLSLSRDHTLELRVSRSGQGLDQPVSFVKTFFRPH